jgi:hypothetical protein
MYRTGNHRHLLTGATFEFVTAAPMKLQVSWDVTLCHLVNSHWHFGGTYASKMSFTIYHLKESNIIKTFEFSDLQFLHVSAIPHETFVPVMHYTCTDNSEESI